MIFLSNHMFVQYINPIKNIMLFGLLGILLIVANYTCENIPFFENQYVRTENRVLTNKNYSDSRYYFTGIIVKNKLTVDINTRAPDNYYVKLVASHYQTNTTIVIDKCKKTRWFTTGDVEKSARKYRKRFPIGQSVIWKRKRIGGKC